MITTALECIRLWIIATGDITVSGGKSNDVKEVMHHDRKDEILKHFRTEN